MVFAYKSAIGQDSHRFVQMDDSTHHKPLVLGGVVLPEQPGLEGNSDADVILHALTNAISGLTGVNILGGPADALCKEKGVTDSRAYLDMAQETLGDWRLYHISVSIEAARPILSGWFPKIRQSISKLTGVEEQSIGLTATSGEALTDFGRGLGIQVFCMITARKPDTIT